MDPKYKLCHTLFPLLFAFVFLILSLVGVGRLEDGHGKDKLHYSSTHVTQTRSKGDNLIANSVPEIVLGLDAFAVLEPLPTQRALLDSDDHKLFYANCIAEKTDEQCKSDGAIPYLVMSGISGESFYLTGIHNSKLLLVFLSWCLSGALAMISAFIWMHFAFTAGEEDMSSREFVTDTLKKYTAWIYTFCFFYVLIPAIFAFFYRDGESRNRASTFYGILSVFSISVSFLWSFLCEKRRILFLKSEFPKVKFGVGSKTEMTSLIKPSTKGEITLPASMTGTQVRSSSVKIKAVYDTTTAEAKELDAAIFEAYPFTPTNTFILKAMIPLFFLWAVVFKTRHRVGLDVDLQLYTIGLTVFALNNYMFKKSFAFVSYTYAWIAGTFRGKKILDSTAVISTYFQIILSSVLVQFLILIVLWLFHTPFGIYGPMLFIFICDVCCVFYFMLPEYSVADPAWYKFLTTYLRNDMVKAFWDLFFDHKILCIGAYGTVVGSQDSAPKTLYMPLGVAQFYGICLFLLIYIFVLIIGEW
jgi:hypothetical protein